MGVGAKEEQEGRARGCREEEVLFSSWQGSRFNHSFMQCGPRRSLNGEAALVLHVVGIDRGSNVKRSKSTFLPTEKRSLT